MFIKVSKTAYFFICGTIRVRIQPNSWYNYSYLAEYSQSLFGRALIQSKSTFIIPTWNS